MSDVKIYTIESDQLSPPIVGEGFCVDMVRHSDYVALVERMKMINELTKAAEQLNEESRKSYEERQQQLAAVGAENAHMQQVIGDVQCACELAEQLRQGVAQ
ncbi:hypothetical protein E2G06_19100 [Salmonella enterica subsp. enterica]|nr:hypothetical protein [Salmonella enterica subsp. enterica]